MFEWIQDLGMTGVWWAIGIGGPLAIVAFLNARCPLKIRWAVKKYAPVVLDEIADVIDTDVIDFSHEKKVTPIIRKLADKIEEDFILTPKEKIKVEKYVANVVKKKVK